MDGERALPARRSRHPAGARYERIKLTMMEAPRPVVAGTVGPGALGELTMKGVKAMKDDLEPRRHGAHGEILCSSVVPLT